MPRVNKSQYAILGFLSKQDMSGYDLLNLFDKVSNFYWSEKNASVYTMLKRLEEQGYVTATVDESSGGRNRRVYSITEAGLEYYKLWLLEPIQPAVYREELLLKIGSAQHMLKEVLKRHLQEYRLYILQQQNDYDVVVKHINIDHDGRDDQPYMTMVYEYIGMMLGVKLKWVEKMLSDLDWDE